MRKLVIAATLLALPAMLLSQDAADRWEPDIQKFEQETKTNPPPKDPIVFYGSSSIRKWDLEKWFPKMPVVNRGFGGSTTADAIQYAERVVYPLKPKTVVLYEGDNDIGRGMTGPMVFQDFKKFATDLHSALPDTKLVFIAIKPSLRRRHLLNQMRTANLKIYEMSLVTPWLEYVDVDAPMLDKDGEPRPELFVEDGLHMTEAGYEVWTKALKPYLK